MLKGGKLRNHCSQNFCVYNCRTLKTMSSEKIWYEGGEKGLVMKVLKGEKLLALGLAQGHHLMGRREFL